MPRAALPVALGAAALGAAFAGIIAAPAARADVLGMYTFNIADPAGDAQTPHDHGNAAPNLTFASFSRTGITAISSTGVFRSRDYSTAASIDINEYAQFSVTADAGYALQLESIAFQWHRTDGGSTFSTRGPLSGAVRSSFEDFAAGSGTGSSWSFVFNQGSPVIQADWDFTDFTSAPGGSATFRFYGWNSSTNSLAGVAMDNVALSGEVVALARMQASASAPAAVLVGDAGQIAVSVQNTAAGGTVQQGLQYAVAGTGDVSGAGGSDSLAPGPAEVVTLSVDTSTAGARTGGVSVTSDNAFSTNGVAGQSSFEQGVTVNVLDHALASLSGEAAVDEITLDFGTVEQGAAAQLGLAIHNLEQTSGFTAGLDLDAISETDAAGVFSSDLEEFADLAAGGSASFLVSLDTSVAGSFAGSYLLSLSDEDLPGAAGGQSLTIHLRGDVTPAPEPGGVAVVCFGCVLLGRRRR